MNDGESAYPFFCLLFSIIVASVSVTAAKDRELALAGMGFASSILSSGGTAYSYERMRKNEPTE